MCWLWVSGCRSRPRVLHKANTVHVSEQVGGESVGWVDFQPVLFWIQVSTNRDCRRHRHLKYTWRNSCCQPDADALAHGCLSCQCSCRSNMTAKSMHSIDRQAWTVSRCGWSIRLVLGITAKLTSRNRSANLRKIEFNILKLGKLGYMHTLNLFRSAKFAFI